MSLTTNVKLGNTIVPSVPFLWYREDEMICSIEKIKLGDDGVFTIVQRNILDNKNIYICLHSLLYYTLFNDGSDLLVIPNNYHKNIMFNVVINGLEENMVLNNNSLQNGVRRFGPVFIHDCAFSPTGFPYFKVNMDNVVNKIKCNILCDELKINIDCLFVLFNDVGGNNIDSVVNEYLERM